MLDRPDFDAAFDRRLDLHLGTLIPLFQRLYGSDDVARSQFQSLLLDMQQAWAERSDALRSLDAGREAEPTWFQSNRMLGGVCYVDRYAGGLAGIRTSIPYFVQLG